MTEYKIEKGIPVPSRGEKSGLSELMRKLEPGDSVFIKHAPSKVRCLAQHTIGVGNYAVRMEEDGSRLWRIK